MSKRQRWYPYYVGFLCYCFLNWQIGGVGALRTSGCYDAFRMSCREHNVPLDKLKRDYTPEELHRVCQRIETEVFEGNEFRPIRPILDLNLESRYLNRIDRLDPFCQEIRKVYSHCSFCYSDPLQYSNCGWPDVDCTSDQQPTAQEVIEDNTAQYAMFSSQDDIDTACLTIQNIRNSSLFAAPKTMDLCDQQRLVYHLCPGQCGPKCFEESGAEPPTCKVIEQSDFDALVPYNLTTAADLELECAMMRYSLFSELDNRDIFNTSKHLEYLQNIEGNSYYCTLGPLVYPHCYWCKSPDVLCFDNEEKQPTCNVPDNDAIASDDDDIDDEEELCQEMISKLNTGGAPIEEVFDLSFQANNLFILEGTPLCQKARQTYHKCLWCHPEEAEMLSKIVNDENYLKDYFCHRNLSFSVPQEYTTNILEQLNISGNRENLTAQECQGVEDSLLFLFALSPKALNETLAAWNLCLDYFCDKVRQAELDAKKSAPDALRKGYLGTTSEAQRNALIWASRCSAFLSFFGACFILVDVLSNPKSRKTVYHQILSGMATFDLVTAIAWGFATAPIDPDEGVKGAIGSDATCTAQGFFVQLGFTSVFYNVSLAIYYVLVIVYSWREFQLKKVSPYLHAAPLTLGFGLAFGGITSYASLEYGCHLQPPDAPDGELWSILVFVVLPLGMSILAITGCMIGIYWSVRRQTQRAKKWNLGTIQATDMENTVFWQCISYVLAFCITWPIMFSVYIASLDFSVGFGLALAVAFVAPLQGFSNFVVYGRTKLKNHARSSENSGRPSIMLSRMFAKLKHKESRTSHMSHGVHNRQEVDDDSLGGMDPSAALALHRDRISEQEASRVCCEAVGDSTVDKDASKYHEEKNVADVCRGVQCHSIDELEEGDEAYVDE